MVKDPEDFQIKYTCRAPNKLSTEQMREIATTMKCAIVEFGELLKKPLWEYGVYVDNQLTDHDRALLKKHNLEVLIGQDIKAPDKFLY